MKYCHFIKPIPNLLNLKKIELKPWLNQLNVGSKITLGYILSIGITIIGVTGGIIISNQYENYVEKLIEDIMEEMKLLSDVKVSFMHVMLHQQAVAVSLDNLEQFQHEYEELKSYESRFNQSWTALTQSYKNSKVTEYDDEAELMNLLIQEYQVNVLPYLDDFNQSVEQLNIDSSNFNQSQSSKKLIQRQINGFHDNFEKFSQTLSKLNKSIISESEEAQEILHKAYVIHNLIIFISIFISVIIALLLSKYITRTISIPIYDLTKITQKVTRDSKFDIQVPVKSQDEIGSLTKSFNHLIAQVNHLLEEQQRSAQSQLIQHEKLSSLGQMVAGIAHEINNPVSCISGNVSYLIEYTDHLLDLIHTYQQQIDNPPKIIIEKIEEIELDYIKEDLPTLLQAIKVSAERTKQIAASLKNFSRLDEANPQPVDIHSCLDSSLLILKNRTKQRIAIQKKYGGLTLIEGYFSSLSQVFINLINNAIDALIEQGNPDPTITIITENLNSEKIAIRLLDNGPGISAENQQKIFESFFTTKPVNIGTGLGLAISREIIEQKHHGSLKCNSQLGVGTEFKIILPKRQTT